jgi:hypothetical protein
MFERHVRIDGDLSFETVNMDPYTMINCGQVSVQDLLGRNSEIVDISHRRLGGGGAEVLLLVEQRGSVHQVDVITEGDIAHWAMTTPATRAFRGHSCLDNSQFCNAATATTIDQGFLVVDRFRVMQFRFTWQPEDTENLVAMFGQMNSLRGGTYRSALLFPGASTVYRPYNRTHINSSFEMTPFMPHAVDTYIFISDCGNHRVVMLNASSEGQMEYITQFGQTEDPRSNSTGLDWPWGLAVYAPSHEALFSSIFANVFVADRMNNRVVKLNLMDVEDAWGYMRPRLEWGGEYSGRGPDDPYNQALNQPVGVTLFRHFLLVGEATGNCITVLAVNHQQTDRFIFITRLFPVPGVQLTGMISSSDDDCSNPEAATRNHCGYVWYTYVELPSRYMVGSIYLNEVFIESPEPTRLGDFLTSCVNDSWYNTEMRFNHTLYYDTLGFVMNATRTNWLFPGQPGYVNILEFNLSYSFHLELWNSSVFGGTMAICQPPPPPTQPPMLSGGTQGWNMEGMANAATGGGRLTSSPVVSGFQLGAVMLGYCCWLLRRPSAARW